MGDFLNNKIDSEKAVLVGIVDQSKGMTEVMVKEYLDELDFLALTAGAETVKRFTQKLQRPNPKTFVGTGKLEEIAQYINDNPEIGLVIFDDELTPSQLRNIERELKRKILDRTNLILDIFASRAQKLK